MSEQYLKANEITDAKLFFKSFEILAEASDKGAQSGNGEDIALMIPAVVNGALACELYMKSMIKPRPRGHKLDELYGKLEAGIQQLIKSMMVNVGKSRDSSYNEAKFMSQLKDYGDTFIEWRYFYEGSPEIYTNFIKDLLYILKGIAEMVEKGVDLSNVKQEIIHTVEVNVPVDVTKVEAV